MAREDINQFPRQSIWTVLGLTVITLGLYTDFWLYKHTRIANRILPDAAIPSWWFPLCLITQILGLSVLIAKFVGIEHPAMAFADRMTWAGALCWVWLFKLRNRMNTILEAEEGDPEWYGFLPTIFFTILYFQYKINDLRPRN